MKTKIKEPMNNGIFNKPDEHGDKCISRKVNEESEHRSDSLTDGKETVYPVTRKTGSKKSPGRKSSTLMLQANNQYIFRYVIILMSVIILIQSYFTFTENFASKTKADMASCKINAPIDGVKIKNKKPKISVLFFRDKADQFAVITEIPSIPDKRYGSGQESALISFDTTFYQEDGPDLFTGVQKNNMDSLKEQNKHKLELLMNFENLNVEVEDIQSACGIIDSAIITLNDDSTYRMTENQLIAYNEFKKSKDEIANSASTLRIELIRSYWDSQMKYIFIQKNIREKLNKKANTPTLKETLEKSLRIAEKINGRSSYNEEGDIRILSENGNNPRELSEEDKLMFDNSSYSQHAWDILSLVEGVEILEKSANYKITKEQMQKIYPLLIKVKDLILKVEKMKELKREMLTQEQIRFIRSNMVEQTIKEKQD